MIKKKKKIFTQSLTSPVLLKKIKNKGKESSSGTTSHGHSDHLPRLKTESAKALRHKAKISKLNKLNSTTHQTKG